MEEFINIPLFAALASWVAAQLIKTVLYLVKYREFNAERLLGAGGMPSAHSAAVCALAVTISEISGINSPEFALSLVFAMVVMYDATGVRRAAGMHAKEINRLQRIAAELKDADDEILEKLDIDEFEMRKNFPEQEVEPEEITLLKEILGHSPFEVLCGALLGILIGMIFITL